MALRAAGPEDAGAERARRETHHSAGPTLLAGAGPGRTARGRERSPTPLGPWGRAVRAARGLTGQQGTPGGRGPERGPRGVAGGRPGLSRQRREVERGRQSRGPRPPGLPPRSGRAGSGAGRVRGTAGIPPEITGILSSFLPKVKTKASCGRWPLSPERRRRPQRAARRGCNCRRLLPGLLPRTTAPSAAASGAAPRLSKDGS